MSARRIEQRIEVAFRYPVDFTEGVFRPGNPVLREVIGSGRVLVFVDGNAAKCRPGLLGEIRAWFDLHREAIVLADDPQLVTGGEAIKLSLAVVESFIGAMLDARLDRHAYVVAVGGGAVLDAIGLAASLVHRGLRMVRLPTTVLAQNDAGVGVKTGIDFDGAKNAIGTFCPPYAVVNDSDFLATLPDREWIAGISEAFKVAIIRDAGFFRWLCGRAESLRARDMAAMKELVFRCAAAHLGHMRTGGDPFELGSARPLDFGHWSAHKLERMSGYTIPHGEAVAIGILLDSRYAVSQGLLDEADFQSIRAGLAQSGLPLRSDLLDERSADGTREIFAGLRDFQEHLGGRLCITLPRGIGARVEVSEIDHAAMDAAIDALRA